MLGDLCLHKEILTGFSPSMFVVFIGPNLKYNSIFDQMGCSFLVVKRENVVCMQAEEGRNERTCSFSSIISFGFATVALSVTYYKD